MRTGVGFDAHRLAAGRALVVGGVHIPFEKGLLGHSDADVLTHAICDALLGAAGLGDIGEHFPDSDPAYKNIDSLLLLRACAEKVRSAGYEIANVDAVVIAQAPRMAPYRAQMRARLAEAMGIETACVGVKASTTEGMGFTGTGEGMAAQAVCLLCGAER